MLLRCFHFVCFCNYFAALEIHRCLR